MHDIAIATEFLHKVPPFNALETRELEKVSALLEAAYYPQDRTIFKSSPPPGLAIIRKGAVRLVDDAHKFLDKRSEGELFGHSIYFHGELKAYTAEAEEDCLVWHLPQDDFVALCDAHPALEDYFSSHLQKRLSAAAGMSTAVSTVKDLLKRGPVIVECSTSIRDAARRMSDENVSSVLVMRDGLLGGIVTDKDLRKRVIAVEMDTSEPICNVMTSQPMALKADSSVDEALLLMMRENCHHLPVMEGEVPVGLVTAGDILRSQSEHPLRLVRDIYKRDTIEDLQSLSDRLPSLFERMVNMGRTVIQIGRMVTHITDAFTIRLIQLAEQRYGEAPMAYAWVAFGSQAREEQTARTDQDNGLILEREPDTEEAEYFSCLANFVCEGLDRLGYVYCPGEVMALNVKWRVSLEQWKQHFDHWIDEPVPKSVMHSSIFFDMRCIHGSKELVDELLDYAVGRAQDNRIFRRFMAANVLSHRPPIGFFRRFVQEDDGSHSEGLNLKHRGIVPITDLVRIRALEGGVKAANTFERLEAVMELGIVNRSDGYSLRDALILINRRRLIHQARQMRDGKKPTNFVPPDELSPLMRRTLKAAFMVVVNGQQALAHRYQVH